MSTIVSQVRFLVEFPLIGLERISVKWADIMKANAVSINEGRLVKIPDELAFQNKLSGPAHSGFVGMINPTFVSRSGLTGSQIRAKHGVKLARAFLNYKEGLDKAFATVDGVAARRFKEQVEARSAKYGRGVAEVLGVTGATREGLGPAILAGYWLTNDNTVVGKLRSGDKILQGAPFQIMTNGKRPAFKAALTGRLVQGGITIQRAGFLPTVISTENDLTNSIVQGYVDPALGVDPFTTGGLSHVDFQEQGSKLYLEVRVSRA